MRIIVFFTVGQERKRCRLVLGGERSERAVEVADRDQLGDPRWVQAKNLATGPIDVSLLVERALTLVMEGLDKACAVPAQVGDAFYPAGVTSTARGFEIELGAFK